MFSGVRGCLSEVCVAQSLVSVLCFEDHCFSFVLFLSVIVLTVDFRLLPYYHQAFLRITFSFALHIASGICVVFIKTVRVQIRNIAVVFAS